MFNLALAAALKGMKEFAMPEWAAFVKTGAAKQRTPDDADFWYKRAASILRQLYIQGVVGVSRLRTRYGSRKNRGVRPAKFRKASGKLIRTILKQAEDAQIVEKVNKLQFGRRLTKKGREFLDGVAANVKDNTEANAWSAELVAAKVEKQEVADNMADTEENENADGETGEAVKE